MDKTRRASREEFVARRVRPGWLSGTAAFPAVRVPVGSRPGRPARFAVGFVARAANAKAAHLPFGCAQGKKVAATKATRLRTCTNSTRQDCRIEFAVSHSKQRLGPQATRQYFWGLRPPFSDFQFQISLFPAEKRVSSKTRCFRPQVAQNKRWAHKKGVEFSRWSETVFRFPNFEFRVVGDQRRCRAALLSSGRREILRLAALAPFRCQGRQDDDPISQARLTVDLGALPYRIVTSGAGGGGGCRHSPCESRWRCRPGRDVRGTRESRAESRWT